MLTNEEAAEVIKTLRMLPQEAKQDYLAYLLELTQAAQSLLEVQSHD